MPQLPVVTFDGYPENYLMFKSEFKDFYEDCCSSPAIFMAHLRAGLDPMTKRRVADCIKDPRKYELVWKRLDEEFWHATLQAQSHLAMLLDIPPLKSTKPLAIKEFAMAIHGAISSMKNYGELVEIPSSGNLRSIVTKLPLFMQKQWSKNALKFLLEKPNLWASMTG